MPIGLAPGTTVHLALAPVDMRKGFDGLAAAVQQVLAHDPFGGHLFLFRSRKSRSFEAAVVGRQRALPVGEAA